MPWSDPDNVLPAKVRIAGRIWWIVAIVLSISMLVLSGAMAMYAVNTPRPEPPPKPAPITFAQDEYTPNKIDLCPYGHLAVDVVRTVRRSTTVGSQATWRKINDDGSILTVLTEPAKGPSGVRPDGGIVHRLIPLPDEVFSPGRYEFQQTVWEGTADDTDSEVAQYIVPFQVRADCGD